MKNGSFDCSEAEFEFNTNTDSKKVSVLLNTLNLDFDYIKLTNVDRLYIPLKFFFDIGEANKYSNILSTISKRFNMYVYMPSVIKDTSIINIESILNNYNIKGFVISNISHLYLFDAYIPNYEIIANYNMNIFNNSTIDVLKSLGINCITISPELDKQTINSISSGIAKEVIIYGNLPVMTTNYCVLSRSNKCLQSCNGNCTNSDNKYYLKDRMDLNFRIISDSFTKTTIIYNSKKLSYSCKDINADFIRLDFMDENIEDINSIIECFKSGNIIEGKDFTNGNFNRQI